jgi:hypothetical protein
MTINEILHYLRNPYGHSEELIREARLTAADLIELLLTQKEPMVDKQEFGNDI